MTGGQILSGLLHWLHLFAAVAWVGGLFFYLMVLLPSLKDIEALQARRLSQIVGMRFRAVSLVTMVALLFTGLALTYSILQGVTSHADFFASPFGRVLKIKLALAVLAIGNGLAIGFLLAPRLVDAIEARDEARMRRLGKTMGILTGVSFLLGVAITVCVAFLHVTV